MNIILQVTYEGVTITIYKEDGLYGYYLDSNINNNLGYTTMEYALEKAKEEVDEKIE